MLNKLIILSLFTAILSGCAGTEVKPVVTTTEHVNTCVSPPKAGSIIMREVNPTVIEDKNGVIWIGITPKHYENLSINTAEILSHIKKKNAVIKYYRDCNAKNSKQ